MKQMQAEVVRLKTELQISNENEKKLKAEIAHKEAIFLSFRSITAPAADRRKTWHHMHGDSESVSKIPLNKITNGRLAR